jgi:ABC-type transport system substrate-binding protein
MKKLLTGALALALSVSLAACSKAADQAAPPSAPAAPTSSAATSSAATPSDTLTTGTATATATGTSTTSAAPGPVDQSTPEAAMTSWLGAMVTGDGSSVCALMATKGKAISSIPGAAATCGKAITPMLAQIKELGAAFKGLKISGATVTGDTASFESVTTEPALAAEVVASFKAVRIGGKWYVTQG